MLNSIWQEGVTLPKFKKLQKDISTDVLIIGGGLAGILCAFQLQKEGIDYTLIEAKEICSSITKNTTAKLTAQHGLIYSKIAKEFSIEAAQKYLTANQEALIKYKKLCSNIDCDFEIKDSFVYSRNRTRELEEEINILNSIGYKCNIEEEVPLPFDICGAIRFKNQAQFNPLKFISKICNNLNIYERTKAVEYVDNCIITDDKIKIKANKIIVATHFPFLNKHGSYFLKLYQHRSYVIALENADIPEGMYVDYSLDGHSFRSYKGMLLLGGGSHRTGKQGGNWKELENFADDFYKNSKIISRWATQDCMTLDGIPYIGQYSRQTPNLYVATGFNKWGFTSAMVAANLLKDLIINKSNPYSEIFSPSRTIVRKQLFINCLETSLNMVKLKKPRCPHLGCALHWNNAEKSWDCPCHGSRFCENGKLIDNPATDDLNL